MSNDTTQTPCGLQIDRSEGYVLQMQGFAPVLEDFMSSNRRSIDLPFTPESVAEGVPAFDSVVKDGVHIYTMHTYKKSDLLKSLLGNYMDTYMDVGVKAAKDGTPSYASTAKHFANIIALEHERKPVKDKVSGKVIKPACKVSAYIATVANIRAGLKKANKAQQINAKVGAGEAFFVEGFNDKNGVARPLPSMKKALSAAARTHFPEEWSAANDANCKEMRKAVKDKCGDFVYKQADAVGKVGQKPTNSFTLSMVEGMHHSKIIRLARANGSKATTKAKALMYIQDNFSKLDFSSL